MADTAELQEVFDRLRRPFPTSAISWRVGATNANSRKEPTDQVKGIPLAYIDARDVMDRLDEVVGPDGWQDEYKVFGPKTVCRLSLRIAGDWIGKEDGAGDTDTEAEKGALSDAFKRSAVRWGVGRYLYGLKSGWIPVEARGKSFIIGEEARKQLDALHDKHIQEIEWGDRDDRNTFRLLKSSLTFFDDHILEAWEEANKGTIPLLPVAMKANLKEHIERIGREAAKKEAA